MNRLNKPQKGIAHLGLVIALLVVVVVGAAAMRVYNNNNTDESSNTESSQNTDDAKVVVSEQEAAEGIEEIKDEKPGAVNYGMGGPDEGTTPTKTVNFIKGGGDLQGDQVVVSLTADDEMTGTCNYLFTLGNSKFEKSNKNVNSRKCEISVPLSEFIKSGNWHMVLAYTSADGTTTGTGGGFDIEVVPAVKTLEFIKGGQDVNSGLVTISRTMTESSTGTCTFSFSLNGTVRVEETVSIANSNTCSIVDLGGFPKSATYTVVVSFVSNDTLTQATTSFDLTVI